MGHRPNRVGARMSRLKRRTITLIQDDEKLVQLLTSRLEEDGFEVDAALDTRRFARRPFNYGDMIILEMLNLSPISGAEIIRKIRRRDSKVPIFVLTVDGEES